MSGLSRRQGSSRAQAQSVQIPALSDLGYNVAQVPGSWLLVSDPLLTVYEVTQRVQNERHSRRIGHFAVYTTGDGLSMGRLTVHNIDMEADSRRTGRPRAREVILSFWCTELQRPLTTLSSILFDTVIEGTTARVLRDYVCPDMGAPWDLHPQQNMYLRLTDENANYGFWQLTDGSRLVRLVAGMLRSVPETRLQITGIDVIPNFADGRTQSFSMMVWVG